MPEPIISVSGLRGIVGESLDPEIVIRYVAAYAATIDVDGPIVVTRDGRTSGSMVKRAVICALQAAGRSVIDAGLAATPTTGVTVRHLQAAGAIQISASHNPPPYNGLKLFSADGRVLPAEAGARVLEQYRTSEPVWSGFEQLGSATSIDDPHQAHLEKILATIDVASIRAAQFHVLLDSNHCSGGLLGRRLLDSLGCRVEHLGADPTGQFWHPPEPTADNLAAVQEKIVAAGAAVGFCQDPDADRLALIDETGRYIGEEYTLALTLDHVLAQRPGPAAANCATSRMSADVADAHGCEFFRSAVGEANVADKMIEQGCVFGGEGNGGPIDPRVGFVRDSFVGVAQILDGLAARAGGLSEWADSLPRYSIQKDKLTVAREAVPAAIAALQSHFSDARPDRLDGLRLDWTDRWLLIRASNTEPIVRVIAEAPTDDGAAELCAAARQVIASL
ncbi:MAG: phosphoglucosamine mutase [Pirellulaceae bacterium]|jgi:phosphomannomutase|nr:phosphoglucosamine mutase [Pirellulaceae bacterium]MDP7017359.1 phosphoglucosamine mutase [Pirellulaceae bacterium]